MFFQKIYQIYSQKMMGIIANATIYILVIIPTNILLKKKLNQKLHFVPGSLHAQASQVEFLNQYACFVTTKKNSKVDGSHSAAMRNLMLK